MKSINLKFKNQLLSGPGILLILCVSTVISLLATEPKNSFQAVANECFRLSLNSTAMLAILSWILNALPANRDNDPKNTETLQFDFIQSLINVALLLAALTAFSLTQSAFWWLRIH